MARQQPLFAGGGDRFFFERSLLAQGYLRVAGVDEVGRGPLAGPVVAACVVLPPGRETFPFDDSKKLSADARQRLCRELADMGAAVGVGMAGPEEIDRINILQASLVAMRRAVEQLPEPPDYLLVDGRHPVPVDLPQQPLVKGDGRSFSIGAASIVAKVTRDELMARYHESYPQYGFQRHKGYPTREHREAIRRHGPSPIHRRTFRGVREFLGGA